MSAVFTVSLVAAMFTDVTTPPHGRQERRGEGREVEIREQN